MGYRASPVSLSRSCFRWVNKSIVGVTKDLSNKNNHAQVLLSGVGNVFLEFPEFGRPDDITFA